jgi:AraC family transcriptional regulator of adaptative response / DNA-3-methyladenine glycosylase II
MILAAREPYDAAALLAFFAKRVIPGIEEVLSDGGYRRSLPSGEVVELRPAPGGMEASLDAPEVRALLDLDTDPAPIAAVLGRDPVLRYDPGVRVPGTVDGGELAVRAVLGQQIALAAAATHAARLVQAVGEPLARPVGAVTHVFPTLEAIAGAPDGAMAMPQRRRDTLRALAGVPLDRLIELPGIGPWTQSYVNMRALRDPDAYLPTDLGVRHALARLGHDGDAERWRPYRAYAVVHLWGTR